MNERDEKFMRLALEQAQLAAQDGETPVGAVCVLGDEVISVGRNRREKDKDALAHAELEAIRLACRKLGGWRLWQCELYVTLEPCPMCAGAIINSRIKRVVYGASDYKAGSCESVINLFELPYNHRPELVSGFMAEECGALLTSFFRELRAAKAKQRAGQNDAATADEGSDMQQCENCCKGCAQSDKV